MAIANENKKIGTLSEIYLEILSSELSNIFVLQKLEEIAEPEIPKIGNNEEQIKLLNSLLQKVSCSLGGVPRIIINYTDTPKPQYDTFVDSLLHEILSMFWKTRRAVIKAHSQYVVVESMRYKKEFFEKPAPEDIVLRIEEYLWDSIEVAYIRMASFWDRIGQLFSFSFFNIRQYEKDGFTSIMEKIHTNYRPILPTLEKLPEYSVIWEYSNNEKENGLKWVLQRRNTIAHSVGLDTNTRKPSKTYDSKYNHLEIRKERKLNKKELKEELNQFHYHYGKICRLFEDCLKLSLFGSEYCITDRKR